MHIHDYIIAKIKGNIMSRILFILKRREDYDAKIDSAIGLSTGLYNSASFMDDMLNDSDFRSSLVVVQDNNSIDREVTKFKPTHVIIEALWVVPPKFDVLQKLHPKVKWIIRLHSELPFLAGEGIAMDWIADYLSYKNVYIGINAPRMMQEVQVYASAIYGEQIKEKLIYMPNFYPQEYNKKKFDKSKDHIDISCFGAVRPLKNHMNQAIAAIKFADSIGKKLNFHVNIGRIEMQGGPVLSNLKSTFQQLYDSGHEMINHQWTPRAEFLELCAKMDIGMQCSFSETFNIVGADLISQGVPLVGSSEIPWSTNLFNARPTDTADIYKALHRIYNFSSINVFLNQTKLKKYTDNTRKIWIKYFNGENNV